MDESVSAVAAQAAKGDAKAATAAQAAAEIIHHPPHSYEGVAPAQDSIVTVDPGVRHVLLAQHQESFIAVKLAMKVFRRLIISHKAECCCR